MEDKTQLVFDLAAQLGGFAPWLVGIVASIIVTYFFLHLGKWEKTVPWQIKAFTRVLILIIFVYLIQLAAIVFLPNPDKIKIFSDGISLVGDIFKTFIGAVIGALSTSMSEVYKDDDQNPANNDETNNTPVV